MNTATVNLQRALESNTSDNQLISKSAFALVEECQRFTAAAQLLLQAVNKLQDGAEGRFRTSGRSVRTEQDFAEPLSLLDRLLNRLSPDDRMESATLFFRRGEIHTVIAQRVEAEDDFAKAHHLLMQQKSETDLLYMRATLEHADALLKNGRKAEAAAIYRTALSFPYYVQEDERYASIFQSLYTRAGYGLLASLRGNRAALDNVHFIPNVDPALLQRLKEEQNLARQ